TIGGLESLVELYLTDNKLMALPPSLGRCRRLRKLQASFNDLRALPKEMGDLEELELFRAAVNPNLTYVPAELTTMARLSWLSLAGCAWCPERPPHAGLEELKPAEVDILGEGASGDVVAGVWRGRPVAVKTFKSAASPDGRAADELAVACFVDHPRLARAVGVVRRPELSLVMERIPGKPLALKPNFASVLRCRWPEGARFRSRFVLSVGMQV
ncbi:unnamed protein product, partial [Phaeothamnion confervicola]